MSIHGHRPRRSHKRTRGRAIVAAFSALGLALMPEACSPSNEAVGLGGECALTAECEPGLVCVPQKGGARACSNDPSGLNKPVVAAKSDGAVLTNEAGEVIEGGSEPSDATVTPPVTPPDATVTAPKDVTQPPLDTGVKDTGSTADTGDGAPI